MSSIPLVLRFADWPDLDRKCWENALQTAGLFESGGAFFQLSEGSLRIYRQGYAQWLSFLARTDPSALSEHPRNRVTPSRVQAFIDEFAERDARPRTISTQLRSLIEVVRAFSGDRIEWLHSVEQRVYRASNPTGLKKPLPVSAQEIFAWALQRLESLEEHPLTDPPAQAVAWRQALMVAIQVACPVRLRAMVAMTLDGHVVQHGDHVMLRWSASDMKDKQSRDMPLPEQLVMPLRAYIARWRPVLLQGSSSNALWISKRGNALSADSYQSGLAKLTKRAFGVPLRPHAFRHIAATSIAETNPAEAGIIRDVLGHSTIRMSEMHYNRATMRQACARLQDIVDRTRKSGRLKKRVLKKPLSLSPEPHGVESQEE